MRMTFTAFALAAALAQPAAAITFPSLTTIYVGSGVTSGTPSATSFHCTNVSGVAATIRYLVLDTDGSVAGSITRNAAHGATITASTRETNAFEDTDNLITPGVGIYQGGVNIELTQSGVFCTAMLVDQSAFEPSGIALHLVRVNPHPGTVE